ncbi:hypothetical protein P3W45_000737 [Vairimorpha bombi]
MEDVKDTENTFSRLLETSKTFCYYFILVLSFVVLKTIFGNWTKYNITYFNYDFITFSSVFDNTVPTTLYKPDDTPDLIMFQYPNFIILRFPVQDYLYFFRISSHELNYSDINVSQYDKKLSTFIRSLEFCNLHSLLIDKMSTPYNHVIEIGSELVINLSSLEPDQIDLRRPKHNLLTIRKSFSEIYKFL